MVYDWINQLKIGSNTRRPSLNREGGSLAKVYTSSPMARNEFCLSGLNRVVDIFVASLMAVCHHLILGRKNQTQVRVSELDLWLGWTSRMSAQCTHTQLYGTICGTLNYGAHNSRVHSTIVRTLFGTLNYGTLWFHRNWYTKDKHNFCLFWNISYPSAPNFGTLLVQCCEPHLNSVYTLHSFDSCWYWSK